MEKVLAILEKVIVLIRAPNGVGPARWGQAWLMSQLWWWGLHPVAPLPLGNSLISSSGRGCGCLRGCVMWGGGGPLPSSSSSFANLVTLTKSLEPILHMMSNLYDIVAIQQRCLPTLKIRIKPKIYLQSWCTANTVELDHEIVRNLKDSELSFSSGQKQQTLLAYASHKAGVWHVHPVMSQAPN